MKKVVVPVTIIVPTIAPRSSTTLRDAEQSIRDQSVAVSYIIREDRAKVGAAANRNAALAAVFTEFVGFLDDDDFMYPDHVEKLLQCLRENNADIAYPLPKVVDQCQRHIPNWEVFRLPDLSFSPDRLRERNFIPVTVLARTELVRRVGGFEHLSGYYGEDHGLWLKMLYHGAKFVHLPVETWEYRWHGGNTSGLPERW